MNRSQYMSYLEAKNYPQIIYNCYLEEVKKEPKLKITEFLEVINTLCLLKLKDSSELLNIVLEHYNRKFKVWRVYNKDGEFNSYA